MLILRLKKSLQALRLVLPKWNKRSGWYTEWQFLRFTIQMKTIDEYFPAVLFIIPNQVVLILKSMELYFLAGYWSVTIQVEG